MKNPFREDDRYRLTLVYERIPIGTSKLLDFGFGDGLLLSCLHSDFKKIKLYGTEPDEKKQPTLKSKYPNITILNFEQLKKLPNNYFDVVTILDVLEHVDDEIKVIREIGRLLKQGGTIFLSVPHKGLTEIFDPGNLKFRSRKIHQFIYENIAKKQNYEDIYGSGKLFGDISRQFKPWHRHYSCLDLEKFLAEEFKIARVTYYGLFFPLLAMASQLVLWIFGKENAFLKKLVLLDSRKNYGKFSYFIFVEARKA